ncbi:MAG TPA: VanZ family protein [Nocardioides sp.]|uniref:VanZ family protein n=1 Tax=Nocardioides sp. TaxID=35761 RepID=UPI002E374A04|nr:VanZ family protein [Nocardioides sp.]HEX3931535.1 VanZ family protein [Nocardioides sp.]
MRWIAAVLLGLYCYVIGTLTLGSNAAVGRAFDVTDRFYPMSEGQANVALFIPAGFLLALVLLNPLVAVALGVLGSSAIEWYQLHYLPWRVFDLHDVLHNGIGAAIGALLAVPFVLLLRWHRRARAQAPLARTP